MPLQATSGAASYDGFGGGVVAEPNYIESCFSTYLYTGTGATQTITNGIDLSTYGGMIWTKDRNTARNNVVYDTTRGLSKRLVTNTTTAQTTATVFSTLTTTSYNADWPGTSANETNSSGETYASWTFRKQPKFFDVVTYTGNGSTQTISHNLGGTVGFLIIKRLNAASNYQCWHRSLSSAGRIHLNLTLSEQTGDSIYIFGNNVSTVAPTSTTFTVGNEAEVNGNGDTFVAYLFAHNAGGFGLTGTDSVISCGSFTTDGSGNATVNLGYEPQFIIDKPSSTTGNWDTFDVMRGWVADTNGTNQKLNPNLSNAEVGSNYIFVNSTGFTVLGAATSTTYIYIAIRRGPMKVPTSGTSVFAPVTYTGDGNTDKFISSGFPSDTALIRDRTNTTPDYAGNFLFDRLRRGGLGLTVQSTGAEGDNGTNNNDMLNQFNSNTGMYVTPYFSRFNNNSRPYISYQFSRAPNFFDVVCYTGTGSARTVNHNLGVAPEMMIVKSRSSGSFNWPVYVAPLGNTGYFNMNGDFPSFSGATFWNNTTPSGTTFSLGADGAVNNSGETYVAYLFASCAGVSKIGTYTGTGATLQVNCGFTAGARFVFITRTSGSTNTGRYFWDSSRGIVSGNDPYLSLNSTAVEVTNTDYVDTYSAGFELSNSAGNLVNASGETYIFLAIA